MPCHTPMSATQNQTILSVTLTSQRGTTESPFDFPILRVPDKTEEQFVYNPLTGAKPAPKQCWFVISIFSLI